MKTETDVQNLSRVALQNIGCAVWRNNRGVAREINDDGTTRFIRYGLGNDSEKLNKIFKTGDLVGIGPAGIFIMIECKYPGWCWCGNEHEQAQLNAILHVRAYGGRAGFVTYPDLAVAIARGTSLGAPHG